MTSFQEVCATQLLPLERIDGKHLAQFLRRERQERFEGNGEVGSELKTNIENGLATLGIRFPHFPRLTLRDILVSNAGEVHGLELGIAELELFQQRLHLLLHILELSQSLFVNIEQLATGRHNTVPILLGELQGTVHEITIHSHQLVVIAILEILPGEVVVLGLRSVGSQHIAQHILFARHIHQILMQPYCPVARGRDLVVLEVQELVGRHVVRHDILAVGLHHHREDNAVEHDIVLADEVYEAGVLILPPLLP